MLKFKISATAAFLGLLIFWAGLVPVAGKVLHGKVTEVKSGDLVTFDYGTGKYDVRLVGIDVPKEERIAKDASEFVSKMLLGKNVHMRFEGRTPNGEMLGQLDTDDPVTGIEDVGLELVKNGMARRQRGEDYQFGYKYGELSKAENEAREAKHGLWAPAQPK